MAPGVKTETKCFAKDYCSPISENRSENAFCWHYVNLALSEVRASGDVCSWTFSDSSQTLCNAHKDDVDPCLWTEDTTRGAYYPHNYERRHEEVSCAAVFDERDRIEL